MKILAFVVLFFFLWIFEKILRIAREPFEIFLAFLLGIGILVGIYRFMPWVFTSISFDYVAESQDCYGINIAEGKCLGFVRNAH